MFHFGDEMEITLYGFIGERRILERKGRMDSSFPTLKCIYDLSIVLSDFITLNIFSVYAFKSEVQMKKNNPLIFCRPL